MGYAAAGLAVIAGGMAVTKKNPYSPSDAASTIGIKSAPTPGLPPAMPSQTSVLQAQQLKEAKDASVQYGRAATVLTGTGQIGAATTGDKLGP